MRGISIGAKIGYLDYGQAELDVDLGAAGAANLFEIPSRSGLMLALPITFGSTVGFTLEPFIGLGDLDSVGVYLGPHFDFKVADGFYIGTGIGVRAGYLSNDLVEGVDLHGRIPLRVTYYPVPDLGLMAEFGYGYGATGQQFNLSGGFGDAQSDFEFGTGSQIDFTVGVRYR